MNKHTYFLIAAIIQRVREFPDDAFNELFQALDAIERKHRLQYPANDETHAAIAAALEQLERGELVPHEDVKALFGTLPDSQSREKAGKAALDDAMARARKRSGEEQGEIADVLFALLDEYSVDVFPPAQLPNEVR